MKQKAQDSLQNLRKLRPERKYVTINNNISSEWYRCDLDVSNRVLIMKWANEHCVGKFSRDLSHYYFENEKDAFAYKLRWSSRV